MSLPHPLSSSRFVYRARGHHVFDFLGIPPRLGRLTDLVPDCSTDREHVLAPGLAEHPPGASCGTSCPPSTEPTLPSDEMDAFADRALRRR